MKFIEFPRIDFKVEGMELVRLPRMMKIRQKYDNNKIVNIKAHVLSQMEKNLNNSGQYKNKRLCVTAGSRGIPHLDIIIRTVIDKLKEWGAEPFIIPAMGSHGGGTAEGQRKLIAAYNVTEESMGVPVFSSMEIVKIGELADGMPIYCDKHAYESDGIVVLNKVKPHTNFRGKHESGMAKMISVGLAKHKGASLFHMKGYATFSERIQKACDIFLKNAPVAFGVGIIQNAYDDICEIEVMEKELILEKDAELLNVAKNNIAKFKFPHIDVLIIDEIGKNVSGSGQDPNITGRSGYPGFENVMSIQKMFIRGLNKETYHNACGLARADITTRRCLNNVDFETTWVNLVTATSLSGGAIPMYMENDRDAILIAIRTCTGADFEFDKARVVRIKDTLHMEEIEVSESYRDEVKDHPDIEILSEPYEMQFDEDGFLV